MKCALFRLPISSSTTSDREWPIGVRGFLLVDDGPIGEARSTRGRRPYLHELNAVVERGELKVSWAYNPKAHREETIVEVAESFMEDLSGLIAHCLSDDAGGQTPSDFPLANVNQEELDRIAGLLDDDGG